MQNTHQQIRTRAYELWEAEGHPAGRSGAHWLEAERAVLAELTAPTLETAVKATAKREPRKTARRRPAKKVAA